MESPMKKSQPTPAIHCYAHASGVCAALQAGRDADTRPIPLDLLTRIVEVLDNYSDVVDSDDGTRQYPNAAMSALVELERYL